MDSSQRCAGQSTPTPFASKDSTYTAVLPSIPMPLIFDPSKRLQELKDGLNPQNSLYYFYEGQHPNIRAVIKAYESGKMPLGSTALIGLDDCSDVRMLSFVKIVKRILRVEAVFELLATLRGER